MHTIQLDELGPYRAFAVSRDGGLAAVAAPLRINNAVIGRMLAIEALLIIGAALAAAAVSSVLVRQSLRPLNRLAQTASEVAALPRVRRATAGCPRADSKPIRRPKWDASGGLQLDARSRRNQPAVAARPRGQVRRFVADASHELRNPLAAIRGYAGGPARPRIATGDTVFALGRIESESQRMSRLVKQMLLLARLDNAPELARAEVDPGEITLNAVSDARAAHQIIAGWSRCRTSRSP